MQEKADNTQLIRSNQSGLLELKPPLTIPQYRDNYGFNLKETFMIYESKRSHHTGNDWYAFPNKSLETLFKVQEKSEGDLLVVYIVETIKAGRVHCHLVLTDSAFKSILADKRQHVLQVHQMYSQFFSDHIAKNMN